MGLVQIVEQQGVEPVAFWVEGFERHARQKPQIAGAPQFLQALLSLFLQLTLAGNETTKVGMIRGNISTEIAGAVTNGAHASAGLLSA